MTPQEAVDHAKTWAEQLGINNWPTIWRVDDISEPDITIGDRDIVTIPTSSQTDAEIAVVVLKYAYHNVAEPLTDEQIHQAAVALSTTYSTVYER